MGLPNLGKWGGRWLGLPLGGLLAVVATLFTPWEGGLLGPGGPDAAAPESETAIVDVALADAEPEPSRSGELRRGETLGAVFAELGLSGTEAHLAAEASRSHVDLRQLRPGVRWSAWLDGENRLESFTLALDNRGELRLDRREEGWEAAFREFRREVRTRALAGSLAGSLEGSIERAGGDPALAYAMAEVLQWDLDFTRDLRTGDEFRLLFEEIWIEGSPRRLGRILALSYGHPDGRVWDAYEFGGRGYYDAQGRPLQKMFLRSPLPYSRVTSRFSNRRFHPVLKVFRPHHGVDYGAPTGTPARVTASGTVTFAGWDGGGGRTVKVRHPNQYLTAYLHLSRFAKGIRAGARVRQGDVIGYVGSSGLASGPHLDYRVQHRGRWIDPLSLASVPADPLSPELLAEFRLVHASMARSLESGSPDSSPAIPPGASPERMASSAEPAAHAR